METTGIEGWADVLEREVAASRHFARVRVLRETASTQDAARAAAAGAPGLIVVAGRQSAGRGQRGRRWVQRGDAGVAVTFVLPEGPSEHLSMVAGLAALGACEAALDAREPRPALRLKHPNDVVVLDARAPNGRRKLAGVLIEQADGLALVGIGINVLQGADDLGDLPLGGVASSLLMLGSAQGRLPVLCALIARLDELLGIGEPEIRRRWESVLVR